MENLPELKSLGSQLKKADPETNWSALRQLIFENITPHTRATKIWEMLEDLRDDTIVDGKTILGAMNAPAAKGNHHAHRGGWVAHVIEMWFVWHDRFKQDFPDNKHINDRRILEGILYHDLHKVWMTFELESITPWRVNYLKGYPETEGLTWHGKSNFLLQKYQIDLDLAQYHALQWSEGGWAEVQSRWNSILAKVLYLIDEYSGNLLARMDDKNWHGEFPRYPK